MTDMRWPNRTYGTILIINEAALSAQRLTAILTTAGYQVRIASEVGLALGLAETVLPDLILLDIGTRPLDGYELCRQLKASERLQAVPVILTTRPDEPHDKAQGFQAGAADYLPQPYEAPEVLGRVAAHLALARSQAEIARRAQMETALKESEARLREILENALDAAYRRNLRTNAYDYISPAFTRISGYTPAEMATMPLEVVIDRTHPEDRATVAQAVAACLAGQPQQIEYRLRHKDGEYRWLMDQFTIVTDAAGQPVSLVGSVRDVTARRLAQADLHRVLDRLNLATRAAQLGIWDWDLQTDALVWDERMYALYGLKREDFTGVYAAWVHGLHPDDRAQAEEAAQQALRNEKDYDTEFRVRWPDGTVRVLKAYAHVLRDATGRPVRMTGINYDITAQKQAEAEIRLLNEDLERRVAARTAELSARTAELAEANERLEADIVERQQNEATLREVSERLETTQQAAGAGAWEWDLVTDRLAWSPLMFKLFGLDPQTAVASFDTWRGVVHPAERTDAEARIREALETHTRLVNVYRIVRPSDGQVRWINAIGEGRYDAQGMPVKMGGICLDVSAQQAVEDEIRRLNASLETRVAERTVELEAANQELRAGEQRFSSLFYKAPFAAALVELGRGVYIDVNEAWAAQTGYARQEFLGRTALEVDLNPDAALRGRIQADLIEQGAVADQEMTVRTKSGERRDFLVKFDLIDISGQSCILLMAQDITRRKQQEMQITRLVERFDLATRAARLGVWEADVVEGAQIWDDRMYALYGVSRETFPATSQAWLNCIHPDDRVFSHEASQKALSGEKEYDTEFRVVWPDGSLRWLKAYGQVIRDAEGKPQRMMGINYDITARKQAEEAQQRWAHVFEHAEWGIVIGAANGQTIELLNPAFARMHGYTVDELIGQSVLMPFAPEVRAGVLAHIQQAQERGHHTWEDIHIRNDGSRFPVLIDVTAVRDLNGDIAYRAVNVQDITARKRAEAEIRQLNEDLKQHVAELHQANAALTQALQVKNEFLAMMSHELRTPLTAVLGLAETLDMGLYGPLTEKQSRSLQTIQRSGQHLLDLITEVLDFISLDAGRLKLTMGPVVVPELCDLALQSVRADAQRKRLHLTLSPDAAVAVVQGDGRRLKQMLVKLLENAVKFTPEGGTLGLGVTGDAARREVRFEVWDTGIGIAPADQARLFEPFVQIDARLARRYEGTGMGLALAKRLAEVQGGRVAVESEGVPGKGSRFTVSLPWAPLPSVASPAASGQVAADGQGADQPDHPR